MVMENKILESLESLDIEIEKPKKEYMILCSLYMDLASCGNTINLKIGQRKIVDVSLGQLIDLHKNEVTYKLEVVEANIPIGLIIIDRASDDTLTFIKSYTENLFDVIMPSVRFGGLISSLEAITFNYDKSLNN